MGTSNLLQAQIVPVTLSCQSSAKLSTQLGVSTRGERRATARSVETWVQQIYRFAAAKSGEPLDLNIGEVLEHWTVPYAIREIIGNALDEHVLTGSAEPIISCDEEDRWHIVDHGRGLRYGANAGRRAVV